MLRKQLIVFVVFAAMMAALTALSYLLTTSTGASECRQDSIADTEACR